MNNDWPPERAEYPLAVLASGGLDSSILIGEAVRAFPSVQPIFIRTGSRWESVEKQYLRRFLAAIAKPNLKPLVELELPMSDLYGEHWSTTAANIPGPDTPDEAVFLPGRNVILLAKALLWCHLNHYPAIATAPLATNPFPDATPAFYDGFARIVSLSVNGSVRVLRPYADLGLHKVDVLRRGRVMPVESTFSCISPMDGLHCGQCNKCAERMSGFREAGLADPTRYYKG